MFWYNVISLIPLSPETHLFLPYYFYNPDLFWVGQSQSWGRINVEMSRGIWTWMGEKDEQGECEQYLILPKQIHIEVQVAFMRCHLRVECAKPQEHLNTAGSQYMLVLVE